VLYTPANEHFGIVPIEVSSSVMQSLFFVRYGTITLLLFGAIPLSLLQAMQRCTPVIAVASGGPLETIEDQVTGFLCEQASYITALIGCTT
jgi:glycosyltransferase involved in cell wall biosynthesis